MAVSIWVGTSGFSYSHWRDVLYPSGVSSSRYLEYYSKEFRTVEINASFYRAINPNHVEKWYRDTPDWFRFAVKCPRSVTHILRLEAAGEPMKEFAQSLSGFGDKLGPVLVQCPPSLRADEGLLRRFLDSVPENIGVLAFEFRHDSWFDEHLVEIAASKGCMVAHDFGKRNALISYPGRIAYFRLHGPASDYSSSYSDDFLASLADVVSASAASKRDVYVYFNNDVGGCAVRNARTLIKLLEGACAC